MKTMKKLYGIAALVAGGLVAGISGCESGGLTTYRYVDKSGQIVETVERYRIDELIPDNVKISGGKNSSTIVIIGYYPDDQENIIKYYSYSSHIGTTSAAGIVQSEINDDDEETVKLKIDNYNERIYSVEANGLEQRL